jgi:hypothetical protein
MVSYLVDFIRLDKDMSQLRTQQLKLRTPLDLGNLLTS